MTRPSPRPRKTPAATLGVEPKVTQKSGSERLTGVSDQPEPKQATWSSLKFVRSETPIGFESAHYLKSGVDLAPAGEQIERPEFDGEPEGGAE